jgi:hypothetical protein
MLATLDGFIECENRSDFQMDFNRSLSYTPTEQGFFFHICGKAKLAT